MTDRSIPRRISDRYLQLRNFYREVKLDIRCIIRDDTRGAVLLVAVAFCLGAILL